MAKQTKTAKGGSPKKAIKRIRRKAVATLRQARLTAQLELLAAEATAAQIREQALEAAAIETAAVRIEAQVEVSHLLEQSRTEAAAAAAEHRATGGSRGARGDRRGRAQGRAHHRRGRDRCTHAP